VYPTPTAITLAPHGANDRSPPGDAADGQPPGASRWLTIGALCLGLAACGGQPGGADANQRTALLVTVSDTFGAKVDGAFVQADVGGVSASGSTNAQGVALLGLSGATGEGRVTISRASFVANTVFPAVPGGSVTELAITLERAQSAAGGSLKAGGDSQPVAGGAGPLSLTFETELVVVDSDSKPLQNLSAADFSLRACAPRADTVGADCVRGADAGFDAAYSPLAATPESVMVVPGLAAQPFATALLMDQSGSIQASDPTGARLFAAKSFLLDLGPSDRVLLAAFADGDARIPSPPLTAYPPFRDATTLSAEPSYFATVDSLATLVGGSTPLYGAIDRARAQVVGDPSLPAGIAKTLVVFTDGDATDCGDPNACRTRRDATIQAAQADGLRIVTIGLSGRVNAQALGELANGTGGAFLYADNAEQALTLYGSINKLLSLSMPTYRLRWTVQFESQAGLTSGNTLVGRVQVKVGQNTIEVPFIVAVP